MAIGEIVLGSFLASLFQVLFEKLTPLLLGSTQREGISIALLKEWEEKLKLINAMLADAEDKQLEGSHLVKLWLDNAGDLAYDTEDLLNEFAIKTAQVKMEVESSTSKGRMKWKFSCFGRNKPSRWNLNPSSLVSKTMVQEINGRLEAIVDEMARLGLEANVVNRSNCINKRDSTSSLPERRFFGREEEEREILKLLIREVKNNDATLSIVAIVGMGGVGKTALAQQLYNNAEVNSYFEKRAWVCVSDDFDVFDITKTILQSITGLSSEGDLNVLQVKLKDSISGKKFLVVLDDIWNEKYKKWTDLLKPFEVGARGSKIIITTRNLKVASITGASPYHLRELSFDNCVSLLAFHALGATNFESHPAFKIIGMKIAERCKGLPLAAKVLGGVLRTKSNPDEWEDTLNNKIWDLPIAENEEVLPVLKLSYVHLPSHLKRCFAYCAVFPKDYEIERDELVLLWIAEGLLDGQKANENILKLGRKHFDELVSRSFLQQSSIDVSKFSMHDLLNDLAKLIARRTCFSSGGSQVASNEHDVSSLEKTRYASFIPLWYVTSKCLKPYQGMKALRSLILVCDGYFSISNKELHDLLKNLKYLRVFSLCHCFIEEVPNCVGDLKHLQYLNFSYTHIKRLPESIDTLCKLQALILRGCQMLSKLPQGITKLVSLQFLDIRDTVSLKEMPLGIGNLEDLIILSKFVVGREKGSQLKELKKLPHLEGELFISELQMVEKDIDATDANFLRKLDLANLSLHWDKHVGNLQDHEHEARVLDFLHPHTNLENLTILNYGGARFPSWLGCTSYSKIVSLCLWDCPNVISLPILGQLPSLKELSLKRLCAIRMIGSEFYRGRRPFSLLTTLEFKEMLVWKDWSPYVEGSEEEVSFFCLQHLVVWGCPLLVGTLPCQLDHLIRLEIHSCPHLKNSTNDVCLPSLHELFLKDCNKEILKRLVNLTSLTNLRIKNLVELVCFDHGLMSNLIKLKELHIEGCDQLQYLWEDGNEMLKSIASFSNLTILNISECPALEMENFPPLPITLLSLEISDCPKMKSLPNHWCHLTSLEYLLIRQCKNIKCLPDGGLPPNLVTLIINGCENLEQPMREWGLPLLMSLTFLNIDGSSMGGEGEKVWFPSGDEDEEDAWRLLYPSSLTRLYITNMRNVERLSRGLRNHLSSLRRLRIEDCPKLRDLPEDGLPPSLHTFIIHGCEILKDRCSKHTGDYWPLIDPEHRD
ncbi:putative disease resistance protein At3g14460 isoform X1 [Eucalyptus grandis]|uniref:putative disease resistance protein At3g14460 isoform X1 n=1 Tax=Eucalyptus grandis TaxID=71139 RepID=UPI00192EB2F7|nr:putative disease resistance protein At3g14460 isoform X1 [Eucalyptus grandis]XP_039163820.1 putative disease resistance protein At3g14460 isoform X1 [Eucalyptus grandis]XP_039163821.1 putative disease resistance protein At3g14460 isoform X1 [Eucalyptus grandis]XP_039163822.1 putative disease resistance protein At3g14460 isoform X1 [Eucalyptus grandis]